MDDSVTIIPSYHTMQSVVILSMHATSQQLHRHPSSGALKVYGFHIIMIPYYLICQSTYWATKEVIQIIMLALYPFLPWLRLITHWMTITITVPSLIVIEAVRVYAAYRMTKENPTRKLKPPGPLSIQPPLPRKYMVLAGVMLWQLFVGWMKKMTINIGAS